MDEIFDVIVEVTFIQIIYIYKKCISILYIYASIYIAINILSNDIKFNNFHSLLQCN